MNDERLPKITLSYKRNKKRKLGRIRKNWMDDIVKELRDKVLEGRTLGWKKGKKTILHFSDLTS